MNNNKAARVINTMFTVGFIIIFAMLFLLIILTGYSDIGQKYSYVCTPEQRFTLFLTFVGFTAAFVAAVYVRFYRRHTGRLRQRSSGSAAVIISVGLLIILTLQIFCASELRITPENDPAHVLRYSSVIAREGKLDCLTSGYRWHYAIKYPNNLGIILLFGGLQRIEYLLTGQYTDILPLAVNILAVNLAILFAVLLAKRLYGGRHAVVVLIMCAAFMPFYTYIAYYYTDTLSMPFITGGLYLFYTAQNARTRRKRYILTAVCGAVLLLGELLKGSVVLILPVLIIYAVLRFGLKRAAATVLCLLIGFGTLFSGFNYVLKPAVIPPELSQEYEYPYTHWVMMGLKGNGDFSKPDSQFTTLAGDKDAKTAANLERIFNRFNRMGPDGTLAHFDNKAVWTWQDGTYYVSHPIDSYKTRSFLHDFLLMDGEYYFIFYAYSCAYQLFLIFMMIISGLRIIRCRRASFRLVLMLSVAGIFVFLLFWETRPRYLLNFTPVFILLASDGMSLFSEAFEKIFTKKCKKQGAAPSDTSENDTQVVKELI